MPIRRHEAAVTTLSRDMVSDFRRQKRTARQFTPDLASRRVGYHKIRAVRPSKKSKVLELESDEEEKAKRLNYDIEPKFRSTRNSPYHSREREQLRTMIVAEQQRSTALQA